MGKANSACLRAGNQQVDLATCRFSREEKRSSLAEVLCSVLCGRTAPVALNKELPSRQDNGHKSVALFSVSN